MSIVVGALVLVRLSAVLGLYCPASGTSLPTFYGLLRPIVIGLTSSINFLPVSYCPGPTASESCF